ncbi:MAG: hypothetical protein ACI9R3_001568 [Verrucomicrobiales bacterium]
MSLGYNLSDVILPDLNGTEDRDNVQVLLGELRLNSGSVPTYATLDGSPARDSGNPLFDGNPATDARGFPRVASGRIDIGAYEHAPATGLRILSISASDTRVFIFVANTQPGSELTVEASPDLKIWIPQVAIRFGNILTVDRIGAQMQFRVRADQ